MKQAISLTIDKDVLRRLKKVMRRSGKKYRSISQAVETGAVLLCEHDEAILNKRDSQRRIAEARRKHTEDHGEFYDAHNESRTDEDNDPSLTAAERNI